MKDNITWESVPLSNIFSFERGKEKNMASLVDGNIPLVSARNVNNGIKGFVGNPTKVMQGGTVITLNNDGDGGAGLAFYQSFDFALDTHVTALWPQESITPESLLYITASLSKQHAIFGHGRSISMLRAERLQNMLPVTDDGKPDYKHMSDYVREHRKAMLNRYRTYVTAQIVELGDVADIPALNEKKWLPVRLSSMGEISSGRDIYAEERIVGDTPYITSGSQNNGIGYYVRNENDTLDCNFIAFNRNGAVGKAFYHSYKSLMSNDCRKMHLTNHEDNKYVGMFISTVISMQSQCFSYSRKLGTARANQLQVMLPVTNASEPDYEYMEKYTKNMMLKKYKQYLAFLNAKEHQSQQQDEK